MTITNYFNKPRSRYPLALKDPNCLPVIDFTKKNLDPSSSFWPSTRQAVVRALEDYGCFIALYDEVTLELNEAIFRASEELFDLPTEIKVLNTSNTPSHGYVGQEPIIPLYEGLGIENATTLDGVQKFTNLLWPNGNHSFSETAFSYSKIVAELDQIVMRMVSEAYGIEKNYESLLGSMSYLLRLIKYRRPHENEKNLGIVPHTDKSFMSILQQDQVKGLEIKTKDGEWMVIDPSPFSFIVMAGDVCMAWTNGRIEPPHHRVIMTENAERYSLGLFTFIRDLIVHVPEELVDDEHPLQFKPFDHYKYIDYYYTDEGKRSKCPIRDYCGV
ncbi:probable 2-oxoglutarate-dependent dioxygenase AOP1 [Coffea eugenioides]|uniref:probable 2-oxoglutarate-dependent dioxygenase AOP1 n=1 Tax=Coffea eugenioides TaxID=49369 RepID=UPI000F607ADD|nr:probable 2-oxoglutarate-dependent dioxygenase AOP1 [Coffea eugenioides]XP_027166192.1 probable 2-oxoglutarate-dependent dioxygenase AOP1 [Coffea eugenioides]